MPSRTIARAPAMSFDAGALGRVLRQPADDQHQARRAERAAPRRPRAGCRRARRDGRPRRRPGTCRRGSSPTARGRRRAPAAPSPRAPPRRPGRARARSGRCRGATQPSMISGIVHCARTVAVLSDSSEGSGDVMVVLPSRIGVAELRLGVRAAYAFRAAARRPSAARPSSRWPSSASCTPLAPSSRSQRNGLVVDHVPEEQLPLRP